MKFIKEKYLEIKSDHGIVWSIYIDHGITLGFYADGVDIEDRFNEIYIAYENKFMSLSEIAEKAECYMKQCLIEGEIERANDLRHERTL